MLTGRPVASFNVADLHGVGQHSSQTERHSFGVLFSVHGDLETVTEINVHNLARNSVKHEVGRMAITQAENVSNH